jgi:hypothetical protein
MALFLDVMPGLVPGIHVLINHKQDVDGRDKPGHDDKHKHRRARAPRCSVPPLAAAVIRPMALSLDLVSNSESSQQDGANEQKHGAHRQDIEPQGKVHVRASLMIKCCQSSRHSAWSEAANVLHCRRFRPAPRCRI